MQAIKDTEYMKVEEVAASFRIGKALVYAAIKSGELRHKRFGRIFRVRRQDAEAWFSNDAA